jgi:solute carrier family 35 protein E3
MSSTTDARGHCGGGDAQIAKIGTTPMVVVLETVYFGKVFSRKTKLSLIPVCLGVLLTSATDIQFNFIGATHALLLLLLSIANANLPRA